MRFRFTINQSTPIPGPGFRFQLLIIDAEGETCEEAHKSIQEQIPEGKFVMAVWAIDSDGNSIS